MAAQSWIRGKLLGAGAFGSVNLAINREDGEVFAVKSVQVIERDAGSVVAVRAIENEIEILQKLDSRFVVRCLGNDWSEESGQLTRNVFLEYMPEGCLTDFVKQFASAGALDEHLLRTYTRSIVEGIEYLHSNGIVHGDIKGKNILVGNGNVKLTDFGSSKRVGEVTESEVAKCSGTPLWMAPEVARQDEQGPASDIWSLGCTVVEMATGRAPWNKSFANCFAAFYHIGCTDELPEVPASLSAEAHDFLSHCFQRVPSKRWTSAQLLQHPFLTTRFVAAPISLKAPVSPISVMQFPADSDCDLSASFVNSVPTLAAPAPSLFKRGLVSAQPKVQEQENWWSSLASPDSGAWIVVKSPKSSSSPPSFVVLESESTTSSVEASIVGQEGEDCETNCDASEISAEESIIVFLNAAAPFLNVSRCLEISTSIEVVVGTSEVDDSQIATGFHVSHFAIFEVDFCVALRTETIAGNYARLSVSEKPQSSMKEEESPSTSLNLNLGFGVILGTIREYSEHENVYQYSNPQILLYCTPSGACVGASSCAMCESSKFALPSLPSLRLSASICASISCTAHSSCDASGTAQLVLRCHNVNQRVEYRKVNNDGRQGNNNDGRQGNNNDGRSGITTMAALEKHEEFSQNSLRNMRHNELMTSPLSNKELERRKGGSEFE